ncbi:tetratricopeptide repeat protein [Actinomadura darangshiensis]|uniref:Tetratricopeptide repeat protein n=1 Tax=Actinomadura darangshiensis TaxID=705336 RepID=A0A4R5B768_9ACTN|nr:tetratricopeptide repeat protein [Actinomadura darangshiensis]TDD79494.1 tetratricopeptide repeat protein [Actinomadura darangshiensis]
MQGENRIARAHALHQQGHLDEAEREFRAALDTCVRTLGPDHPDTTQTHRLLVSVLLDAGRLADAEREHRTVLETCTRTLGPEHPETLGTLTNHGRMLQDLGRLDEAVRAHLAVLEGAGQLSEHRQVIADAARANLAAARREQ